MIDRRRYRKVFVRIWSNPEFRTLQDGERVMALYLLSGPQTNRVGLFRVSIGAASEDLNASLEAVRKRLDRVCAAFGWEFDEAARVLYIPSWWSFNPLADNEKNVQGALSDLNDVPRTPLIYKFCQNLGAVPESVRRLFAPWEAALAPATVSERCSNGAPNTVRSQETRQDKQEQDRETAPHGGALAGFDEFWGIYPKRKSKSDAERAWRKLAPSPDLRQRIYDAIAVQQNSEDWRKEGGKFIPYPASWLNGRRWEDEVEQPARSRSWRLDCHHEPECGSYEWHLVMKSREKGQAV